MLLVEISTVEQDVLLKQLTMVDCYAILPATNGAVCSTNLGNNAVNIDSWCNALIE